MSSFLGHALIGLAIGDNARPSKPGFKLGLLFALLAIGPDLDYLLLWGFGIHWEPRHTHSLAGALLLGAVGLLAGRALLRGWPGWRLGLLILAAPLSHLVLDFFVGVHRNPLLWPLDPRLYAFDWGVLPSAGRLHLGNFYFWRNLGIELGILLPIALLISARGRQHLRRRPVLAGLALLCLLVCVAIGLGLRR